MLRRTCCVLLLSFVATSISAQQTIYFKKDHIYNGPGGKEVAVMVPTPTDVIAPTPPSGLASSNITATSVQLSWTGSTDSGGSGLAGYKIYREQGTGANLPVGTVGPAALSFTDQPLMPSTGYTYTVVAFDNAQNHSATSNAVAVTTLASSGDAIAPSVPQNFTAQLINRTGAQLNWNASVDSGGSGLAGYRVFRGGTLISGPTAVVGTSYQDTGLANNTTYSYTVAAVDNAGNTSPQTGAASITTARSIVFQDNFNTADASTLNSANWGMGGAFAIRSSTASALAGAGYAYNWQNAFTAVVPPLDFRMSVKVLNAPEATGLLFWAARNPCCTGPIAGYRAFVSSDGTVTLAYYTDIQYGIGTSGSLLAQATVSSPNSGTLVVLAYSATGNIQVFWNDTAVINYTETNSSRIVTAYTGFTARIQGVQINHYFDDFILENY